MEKFCLKFCEMFVFFPNFDSIKYPRNPKRKPTIEATMWNLERYSKTFYEEEKPLSRTKLVHLSSSNAKQTNDEYAAILSIINKTERNTHHQQRKTETSLISLPVQEFFAWKQKSKYSRVHYVKSHKPLWACLINEIVVFFISTHFLTFCNQSLERCFKTHLFCSWVAIFCDFHRYIFACKHFSTTASNMHSINGICINSIIFLW